MISRDSDNIVQNCEVDSFASDHNAITFKVRSGNYHPRRKTVHVRKTKLININFLDDIKASKFSQPLPDHVDEVVHCFNTVLRQLLDKHAPEKSVRVP